LKSFEFLSKLCSMQILSTSFFNIAKGDSKFIEYILPQGSHGTCISIFIVLTSIFRL
jgi:hypothetical protein